jgi:hypothetical protein
LRPKIRTSFHHQPEAQHPKIVSYPQAAGRLPHLMATSGREIGQRAIVSSEPKLPDVQSRESRHAIAINGHAIEVKTSRHAAHESAVPLGFIS